ncbi:MAG TPA: ribonuclease HII [Candidatus Binatia bacterium]|jgi:ribonuclease HII
MAAVRPAAPSLAEIRRLLSNPLCDPDFIESLRDDPRDSVASLLVAAERRRERQEEAQDRTDEMLAIEKELQASGRFVIAGVDEAGMGPLAGPIVAAAVILGDMASFRGIHDSKNIGAALRASLAVQIRRKARSVSIGIADVDEINELNVYHAGLLAMRRAVEGLTQRPDHALVDARRIPDIGIEQSSYIRGDSRSLSIAAASIIAKTHRDSLMDELDVRFPGYGFCRHKGYATPEHQSALRRLGPSAVHRTSYDAVQELVSGGRQLDD